jgi:hypothetical protein
VAQESKGALSQKVIITETIKRFQESLPWLNRNNLNYFIHQQQVLMAVGTIPALVVMIPDREDRDNDESNRT